MAGNTNSEVLMAGAFAEFSVDLLIYPLDTLKTRYQSPDYKAIYYNASKTAINKTLLFRGLYQGVGSIILVTVPSSGVFFTVYEAFKSRFMKINPTWCGSNQPLVPQPFVDSVSSSVAELASCIILTPAEVIKQNAQVIRRPAHRSSKLRGSSIAESSVTWQALKRFREKPSLLFRGYTALAARNLPFTAIQFPFFEYLKTAIKSHREKNGTHKGSLTETAIATAISAGVAGTVASAVTTPMDVIKTRIMLSASQDGHDKEGSTKSIEKGDLKGQSEDKASHGRRSKMSGFTVARDVIQESGFKGLFRGVVLRCIWTALGSGLYLGVYESGRVWLGDRREERDA